MPDEQLEDLQKEKLREEIYNLKKPFYRQPAFWISTVGAAVAVVGVFAQSYLSRIDKAHAQLLTEKAKIELAEIETKKDSTQKKVEFLRMVNDSLLKESDSLLAEIAALEKAKQNLSKQSTNLIAAVNADTKSTFDKNVQSAVKSVQNSLYSVSLYGFNINPESLTLVQEYLTENGYSLVKAQLLTTRPAWLSLQPTVLYYSNESKDKATTIAEQLSLRTGKKFIATRGSGLGIPKGQESKSIRLHFVG